MILGIGAGVGFGQAVPKQQSKTIVSDNFNRADAPTLGGSWLNVKGSSWGIIGNQAYCPNGLTGGNVAIQETGVSDGEVSLKLLSFGSGSGSLGVTFRYVDETNFFRAYKFWGAIYVQREINGVATMIVNTNIPWANGDILKIKLNGPNINIFVNDISYATLTDDAHLTATKHGLYLHSANNNARVDDFKVEVI